MDTSTDSRHDPSLSSPHWTCERCTFDNDITEKHCHMCATPMPITSSTVDGITQKMLKKALELSLIHTEMKTTNDTNINANETTNNVRIGTESSAVPFVTDVSDTSFSTNKEENILDTSTDIDSSMSGCNDNQSNELPEELKQQESDWEQMIDNDDDDNDSNDYNSAMDDGDENVDNTEYDIDDDNAPTAEELYTLAMFGVKQVPIVGSEDRPTEYVRDILKFTRINIKGDGNCFFHAVIHQLGLNKRHEILREIYRYGCKQNKYRCSIPSNLQFHLRNLLVDHIAKHQAQDVISSYLKDGQTTKEYIDDLRKDGTWNGELVVEVLCKLFGIQLNIMKENSNRDTGNTFVVKIHNQPVTTTISLIYNGSHFDSAIPSNKRTIQETPTHVSVSTVAERSKRRTDSNKNDTNALSFFSSSTRSEKTPMTASNVENDRILANDDDDNDMHDSDSDSDSYDSKHGISPYEQLRLDRIRRNQDRLQHLGLLEFNIQQPPKKKQKNTPESTISTGNPRRLQPRRSAKNLSLNDKPLQLIQENKNKMVPTLRHHSKRIQECENIVNQSSPQGETTIQFDIDCAIMNDSIAARLNNLDDDSYVDEEDEDNEKDLDKDKDSDNNITPQKLKKVRVQIEELFRTEEPATSSDEGEYI